MTLAPPSDQLTAGAPERRRSVRRQNRAPGRTPIGYVFVSLYALLALAFGILPSLYAVLLAFTTADGGFAGLDNFVKVGGWEEWLLSGDLLVRESLGRYDVAEYERLVAHGA